MCSFDVYTVYFNSHCVLFSVPDRTHNFDLTLNLVHDSDSVRRHKSKKHNTLDILDICTRAMRKHIYNTLATIFKSYVGVIIHTRVRISEDKESA
jgi:hypothetical protein